MNDFIGALVAGTVWFAILRTMFAVNRAFSDPVLPSKRSLRTLDPDFHYRSLDLYLERLQQEEKIQLFAAQHLLAPAEDDAHEEPFTAPTGEVFFKDDEPRFLKDYGSQPHIVRPLQLAIQALPPGRAVLDHKLMTGHPGLGKTLLAKVITHELQQRADVSVHFVETFGLNLESADAMDAIVASFRDKAAIVWFIDEIHVLNRELATKLYPLMEENRYPFKGALNPEVLPPVMVIGATTDYGMLHAALKRRFGEPLSVRTLAKPELRALAGKLGFAIDDAAADLLVSRCWQSGAPYELKLLFREARIFAQAAGLQRITPDVVTDVFTTYEIDENGLRHIDRAVLTALFQRPRYRGKQQEFFCYGGSESDICAMARLDKAEFQETIRPRLMSRGLLEVRSGVGLALTPLAVTLYAEHQRQIPAGH